MTCNNPDIISTASNSKLILRSSLHLSFCNVYSNPEHTRQIVQDDAKGLALAVSLEDEGPLFVPVQRQDPTLAPPKPIPEYLNNARLRAMMREVASKEAERIDTSKLEEAV